MKEIITSNNSKILVDDEDYPLLSRHTWHLGGANRNIPFTQVRGRKLKAWQSLYLTQIILASSAPHIHKNGNVFDFTKENLILHSKQQISISYPKRKQPTSSKYKGVFMDRKRQKWRVRITKDKKPYDIGLFDDELDAALAYNKKAIELFGDDAWLNPV